MDIVTIFQGHHPETFNGWITTDTTKSCAEEIKNSNELFFAYHMPNVFYFAEGGWGHHMTSLGNRPHIPDEVSLNFRFDNFNNSVVINGNYSFLDIVRFLKYTGYIEHNCRSVRILPVGVAYQDYTISLSDPIMNLRLTEFEKKLEQYNAENIKLKNGDVIYHVIFELN